MQRLGLPGLWGVDFVSAELSVTSAMLGVPPKLARRGTTNRNARGSSESRRRRRVWLVETYRANVDYPEVPEYAERALVAPGPVHFGAALGHGVPACRCYRCGCLLTVDTVTVDRIIPGCKGGTYRRNNIRPACGTCNSETGGALRGTK